MEGPAVRRSVVESGFRFENVIEIIVESRIFGNLDAVAEQRVECGVQAFFVLKPAAGDFSPGVFADFPVGLFQKGSHLLKRSGFALVFDRHGARNLLVCLNVRGFFGEEGNVFLPEKFQAGTDIAKVHSEFIFQIGNVRVGHHFAFQFVAVVFAYRVDVLYKIHIGFGDFFVLGMRGHGDVAPCVFFGKNGGKFIPLENPFSQGFRVEGDFLL